MTNQELAAIGYDVTADAYSYTVRFNGEIVAGAHGSKNVTLTPYDRWLTILAWQACGWEIAKLHWRNNVLGFQGGRGVRKGTRISRE